MPNVSNDPVAPRRILPPPDGIPASRKTREQLLVTPVLLGDAVALAQRLGGGDVFAIVFDKRRQALVLLVQTIPAAGRPVRLRTVSMDARTGAVIEVDTVPGATKALPGLSAPRDTTERRHGS